MAEHRLASIGRNSATALTVTFGIAAAAWFVAIRQMTGMDMGTATELGSVGFFAVAWVSMMAAMMLPGAAPAVVRRVQSGGGLPAGLVFLASYLLVWAAIGIAVYAAYRPHGSVVAAAVVVAAGAYELTPVKRHFRRRCQEGSRSGFDFGIACVGSSIGLMAMLVVLGVMSITWMVVIAAVALLQKLVSERPVLDVTLALAILGLGVWILVAPASVPGLM